MARRLVFILSVTAALLALALIPAALGRGVAFTPLLARSQQPFMSVSEITAPSPATISAPVSPGLSAPDAPDANPGTCPVASPIDCATGALTVGFTDLAVPGRGVALGFARTYSSALAHSSGPLGYGWTDSYDMTASTRKGAVSITQGNGATLTFPQDASGVFGAPSESFATLTGSPLTGYTLTLQRQKARLKFSPAGLLLSESDFNGYTTKLRYSDGRLTMVTDPAGRSLTLTYLGGRIATVTDPMGRTESFSYDTAGDLVTAADPLGRTWAFAYTGDHLLRLITDPRGGVTTSTFDSLGRVVSQVDPAGAKTTWAYSGNPTSAVGSETSITDPDGNQTTLIYACSELVSVTRGDGTALASTTSYAYHPGTAEVLSVTDPDGNVTSYTYDRNGNVLTITNPLGNQTSYTYNDHDQVTSVTTPPGSSLGTGKTTSYTYNAQGDLTAVTDPMGDQTSFSYGRRSGDVTKATGPSGQVTAYSYDRYGDISSATVSPSPGLTDTSRYAYDTDGELTCEVSANATMGGISCPAAGGGWDPGTSQVTYDSAGEIIKVTNAAGDSTTYRYNPGGDLSQMADAEGHITSYAYDPDGRVVAVTDPSAGVTSTSYDPDGNAIIRTDQSGNLTAYTYDQLGRLAAVTDMMGEKTTFRYDSAGNRISLTSPSGQTISYTYDQADQLTGITYRDGSTPTVSYAYYPDGQRAQMTDGTGITNYTYNSSGQLTEATSYGGQAVRYDYTPSGQLKSLTYPDGTQVTRSYDGADRLAAVTDNLGHTARFGYDADGNLISAAYPNGVTETSTFDSIDQLTSTTDRKGTASLAQFSYTRSDLGQVTSVTTTGLPAGPQAYTYTPTGQLASANGIRYGYDPSGNLTKLANGTTFSYNATGELTSAQQPGSTNATTAYGYDMQGNRTSINRPGAPAITLKYDQANRLISFGDNPANTYSYSYNGDGLRVSKTINNATISFAWDQSGNLPLLIAAGTSTFIDGPGGQPFEQVNGTKVTYLHSDQQGSIRLLSGASGRVTGTYSYDPYGNVLSHTGTDSTPLQYNGQYTDQETGYQYLQARYYDPSTGQFLSVDPAVSQTGEPYGYAGGNPLNAADPTGLSWWNPFSWTKKTWLVIGVAALAVTVLAVVTITTGGGDLAVAGAAADAAPAVGEDIALAATETAVDSGTTTPSAISWSVRLWRAAKDIWQAGKAYVIARLVARYGNLNSFGTWYNIYSDANRVYNGAQAAKTCSQDVRSSKCLNYAMNTVS